MGVKHYFITMFREGPSEEVTYELRSMGRPRGRVNQAE